MKSVEEIIKQEPIYLDEWEKGGFFELVGDFEYAHMSLEDYNATVCPYNNVEYWVAQKEKMTQALKKYESVNILFATYGALNYEGHAWVLFEQDGKLYEVNGSHCSCYGLEGQWEPEEVDLKELENRLLTGTFGEDEYTGSKFKFELCEFLGVPLVLNS